MKFTQSRTKRFEEAYLTITTAASLLEDRNLEWSADFDSVREPLAKLLRYNAPMGDYANKHVLEIADRLTEEEFDVTI